MIEDKEIEKVSSGLHQADCKSFDQLFHFYYLPICYFAYRLIGNWQESEDITLCALQSLFERLESFKTESQIKAFLYIAARNQCLNYLKHQKLSKKKFNEYAQTKAGSTSSRYKYEMVDDQENAVLTAVEKLPKECRKILKMLYYEELKPNEVAAILQISVRTVYNQKMTGIKTLRTAINSPEPYTPNSK